MKKNKGIASVLIILILIIIGAGIYFFTTKNKKVDLENKIEDNSPVPTQTQETQNIDINENTPGVSTSKETETTNNTTTDCGSISYSDLVFSMFGDESSPKISSKSTNSIKCANDALLACKPAKLKVEGTNINPIFPDQKDFKVASMTYNITTSAKTDNCVVSECVIPKQVIKNRSTKEKEKLIFTLVGMGTSETGRNDVYDPVTKLTTKNVCPNTNNPYQAQ